MPNDLDDRIRDLVSAAVKTAPTAPHVDPLRAPSPTRTSITKRATAAGAAIIAVVTGALLINNGNDAVVVGDHTDTTTAQAPAPPGPSVIVTAGPDGIRENVDGVERVVSRDRTLEAIPLDDGSVIAFRSVIGRPPPPVRIAADGSVTQLFDNPPQGFLVIHDFSIVDGKRLLLYSVNFSTPSSAVDRKVTLYTLDLDTKAVTEIAQIGDAFSDSQQLTLGSNGLIVGSYSRSSECGGCETDAGSTRVAAPYRSLLVLAIPGSPAAKRPSPKPTDYGLQDKYADGPCECPMNFFTDATGTSLYWVSTLPDGTGTAVYSARIDQPGRPAAMVKQLPAFGATVAETFPDISTRGVVVNFANLGDGPLHTPVLLEGDTVVELGGHYAMVGWQG